MYIGVSAVFNPESAVSRWGGLIWALAFEAALMSLLVTFEEAPSVVINKISDSGPVSRRQKASLSKTDDIGEGGCPITPRQWLYVSDMITDEVTHLVA